MGFGEVVAVDPGLRGCGVAVFRLGQLVHARYVHNTASSTLRGPLAHAAMALEVRQNVTGVAPGALLVIEFPMVYPAMNQKGDQNDILEVAGVASAVAAMLNVRGYAVRHYRPREWKGTIKKEVMTRRIQSRLADVETLAIVRESATLDHNTLDAVGIGLAFLGRLNEKANN